MLGEAGLLRFGVRSVWWNNAWNVGVPGDQARHKQSLTLVILSTGRHCAKNTAWGRELGHTSSSQAVMVTEGTPQLSSN